MAKDDLNLTCPICQHHSKSAKKRARHTCDYKGWLDERMARLPWSATQADVLEQLGLRLPSRAQAIALPDDPQEEAKLEEVQRQLSVTKAAFNKRLAADIAALEAKREAGRGDDPTIQKALETLRRLKY